jgi:hypothetical protein
MTYIVERRKRQMVIQISSFKIHYLMYSVKRSFGDDQRLSSRKNNGQGKKTRTYEQFIKD